MARAARVSKAPDALRRPKLAGSGRRLGSVTISVLPPATRVSLRAPSASVPALSRALGVELPTRPKSSATAAKRTALWLGPDHILQYAVLASILGGLLTMLVLFLRAMPLPAGLARRDWIARLHDAGTGVPYGVALAVAGLWIYPHSIWMEPLVR